MLPERVAASGGNRRPLSWTDRRCGWTLNKNPAGSSKNADGVVCAPALASPDTSATRRTLAITIGKSRSSIKPAASAQRLLLQDQKGSGCDSRARRQVLTKNSSRSRSNRSWVSRNLAMRAAISSRSCARHCSSSVMPIPLLWRVVDSRPKPNRIPDWGAIADRNERDCDLHRRRNCFASLRGQILVPPCVRWISRAVPSR